MSRSIALARGFVFTAALAVSLAACGIDEIPGAVGRTPQGTGPLVVFDLTRQPLPEIPLPNDVATVADPTSRTGRRIDVSVLAASRLEVAARQGFADMEGWGTFQPITVSFKRPDDIPEGIAALDVDRIAGEMAHDSHDFFNDPVYLVNLTTGVPVPLDMGDGVFPRTVVDQTQYFPNDPRASEQNLTLETFDEAHGLLPSQYTPALDTDFDGVLDIPNTFGVLPPGGIQGIDNLLTFYERESDTLILRPVIPLDEKSEYAVVLTDRLKDANGRPVRSPFAYTHHESQEQEAERVQAIMNDTSVAPYFGDIAGTGLTHVSFLWSYTTQPVMEDMRLLRDGLHSQGPLAHLANEYPADVTAFRALGTVPTGTPDPAGWQTTAECAPHTQKLYIVKVGESLNTINSFLTTILGLDVNTANRLLESLGNVDYFVVGEFQSPYFLGDPTHEDPDGRFQINFKTGDAHVQPDTVPFWLSVPKATAGHAQPFPTTVWAHGSGNNDAEIIVRAGYWAKQGVAMIGIDMPGHGLVLDTPQSKLTPAAKVFLAGACLVPWLDGITAGRAYDLDGDGFADSGALLWSAHVFHSRDNIRQSVVDMMQTARVLQSFDGKKMSTQDFNGDGTPDLAGDFDGDGTPDVGGSADIFTAGNSLGGILALVHGAVDSNVKATASISGGGGLSDVALRSAFVPTSVLEQVMSPLVIAKPASAYPPTKNPDGGSAPNTQCGADQTSVRFVVNNLLNSLEIEIACLNPAELGPNMTVVLTNQTNQKVGCARADGSDASFRIPIPASVGDALDISVFAEKDAVDSYATCNVPPTATLTRDINSFEQGALSYTPVANNATDCDSTGAAAGFASGTACAQFRGTFYPIGSQLVAPQEGLGLRRQTPDFRKLLTLTQGAFDAADPLSFAPYFYRKPFTAPDGSTLPPRPVMQFDTAGDPFVPSATGYAFGRALGAIPIFPPSVGAKYPAYADLTIPSAIYSALGNKMPDDVLVQSFAIEGLARLNRTSAGAACEDNRVPASTSCPGGPTDNKSFCNQAITDADYLDEGKNLYDAPHPAVPLRLARAAQLIADSSGIDAAWNARITGAPFSADEPSLVSGPMVGVVAAYDNPLGQHVWVNGDPCKAFDDAVYYDHLLVRFLATEGTDVYFLSHATTHDCLSTETCPFFNP